VLKQKLADTIDHTADDIRMYRLPAGTLGTAERFGRAQSAPHRGDHIL
jgi:CRISPR-associated protein Cas2